MNAVAKIQLLINTEKSLLKLVDCTEKTLSKFSFNSTIDIKFAILKILLHKNETTHVEQIANINNFLRLRKMDFSTVIVIVLFLLTLLLYSLYAKIIKNKNKVHEALSGIDVQLKNRSNLIPNILEIANKFMEHEKELISNVTELRTKSNKTYDSNSAAAVKEHMQLASALDAQMGKLLISVEAYPDLKSDQTMQQAQLSYNEVETKIAAARRFYNAAVGQLNNSIEIFPGNVIAQYANASAMPFYEVDKASKEPVDASSFLK